MERSDEFSVAKLYTHLMTFFPLGVHFQVPTWQDLATVQPACHVLE